MSYPTAPPGYGESLDNKTPNQGAPYPDGQYPLTQAQPTPYGLNQPAAPYPDGQYPLTQAQPTPYGLTQPAGHDDYAYSPNTGGVYAVAAAPSSHPAVVDGGEAGFTTSEGFADRNVRRMFIRKVFIILGLQLLLTFGIVCIFTLVDDVKLWVKAHEGVYYASYGVFIVLYFALICVESLRRRHPLNLIMLAIFTLALSYMAGTIAAFYNTKSVMVCLGTTVLVCTAIILFSMQTRFDFTQCSGVLFVLCMTLFWFGFISIFTAGQSYYLEIVYGCIATLIFVLFLAFDVQLIMGQKKHKLSEEEYVLGALLLYVDVVYIFLLLLALFGVGE